MKSNWQNFKDYINSKKIGEIIKRKDIVYNIDNYKAQFVSIGFLKEYKRGQYILCCHIPDNLTTSECFCIAYTYTKDERLRYIRALKIKKILETK